ncbi:hypothetical protein GCM10009777_17090 [Microbacterium pumilum]|uniref:Uncharacterized protein n=1 Tax=Microbacterium pumilum TaxID=344165 RepID=A0ABN2SBS9_9MICO
MVLPGAALVGDPAAWAATAADELADAQGLSDDDRRTLARALIRAQQSAVSDLSTNVLLHDPGSGTWAPLRLTLLERQLDEDEQREYLWPPAILPPQVRLLETRGLGLGCSSTLLADGDRGSVRWLFMPSGVTFFAAMAPVPSAAVIPCAVAAEDILTTVRIDGVAPQAAEGFDARRLIERTDLDDRAWRV